jgi:hypothetical protein
MYFLLLHLLISLAVARDYNVTVGKPAHKFGRPLIEKAGIGDVCIP